MFFMYLYLVKCVPSRNSYSDPKKRTSYRTTFPEYEMMYGTNYSNVCQKTFFLFFFTYITTILGGQVGGLGQVENKANSVQLQLQLPTVTELGNNFQCTLYRQTSWAEQGHT